MILFQRSEMHKKEERRGRMGGLEAREIGIKKDGKEVRGGEGAWGTSRPRRDKSVPDEGWTPLGSWEVWSRDLPGPSDPWERTLLSGSGAVPELGRHRGAEGARRGSPRSSNVGGRGPCGRVPVLAGPAAC